MTDILSSEQRGVLTAQLWEAGVAMMEQSFIRRHDRHAPEVARMEFEKWLYRANDPIPGDVAGDVRIRQSTQ